VGVLMLRDVLSAHTATSTIFCCGALVGFANNARRSSNIFDMTYDSLFVSEYEQTLDRLRLGEINLLIATSVAEEGLDIQACGSVIRFDLSPNLQSWIQSQGRARKQRSTSMIMIQEDMHTGIVAKWEGLRMMTKDMCKAERERLMQMRTIEEEESDNDDEDDEDEDSNTCLEIESTR
jgi:endoribonuclease Dicer